MLARIVKLPSFKYGMRYSSTCGPPNKIREAPTQLTTLENGIRIATQETYEELGAATMMIETGPRFEEPENNGINNFIEHMVYKGFRSMNRCAVEEQALYSSIRFTADTTQELQWFRAICPSACIPVALNFLSKIISEPLFSQCEVKAEQNSMNLQLYDTDVDPKKLVFENLLRTAFQGTPLGQTVIGTSKNLLNFDSSMAVRYAREQYEPWRIVFGVSGRISHQKVVADIACYLGKMPICSSASEFRPCRFTGSEMTYRDDSMPFAHVCIAYEAPGVASKSYPYMRLMKNVIGSWDKSLGIGGPMPELAKRCAVTSLCERFESFYLPFSDVGLFGIYFVSERDDVEDMIHNVHELWKWMSLATHMTEMKPAKQWTMLEICKERTGAAKASLDIARDIMYFGKRRSLDFYKDRLDSVKYPAMLSAEAEAILYNCCPAVAAAGPTEALVEYNRMVSGTYWVRW